MRHGSRLSGSGAWVLALAALALGAVGWLVLSGESGPGAGEPGVQATTTEPRTAGPTLVGRDAVRPAAAPATAVPEQMLEGRVLDAAGKPVPDVPVTARKVRDAYPEGDARRWRWDPRGQLEQAASELAAGHPRRVPPVATVRSAADGTFRLSVPGFSEVELRAEPAPPLVGTHATLYVNERAPGAPTVLRVLVGSRLRGRVVDGQDRGVAASLAAHWFEEGRGTWSAEPARSDAATGAFELAAVPAGKVSLDLIVPGRVRLSGRSVGTPTDEVIVIRVGDAAPLVTGQVTNLAGSAVPGATVSLSIQDASAPGAPAEGLYARYVGVADADGRYTIHGAHGGRLTQAEVVAPGYLYASQQPPLAPWTGLELAAGKPASLDFVLYQGGVLTGRVVERGSAAPLAGATLRVMPSAVDGRITRPSNLTATSDAQGRFRVEGLPVGRNVVLVHHDGWWFPPLEAVARSQGSGSMIVWDGSPTGPPAELLVFVQAEGQAVERTFELVRGLAVRGRVVNEKGAPVEGAEVRARNLGLGQAGWQWGVQADMIPPVVATSGRDGAFEVAGLPPRPAWVLQARKAPRQGEPCEPFALAAGATTPEVVLRLVPGATLAGRVVDADGRPVAGAPVSAWPQTDEGFPESRSATTGEDGAWRLEGLPAGTIGLNANPPSGGGNAVYRQVDGLAPGETREGLELRLAASRTVSGVLVDESGAPQRGKALTFVGRGGGHLGQVFSGADGTFSCSSITEEQVRILGGSWENQNELTSVRAPVSDLRLIWKEPPLQVIEGTVVDDKGRPVPVCQVGVRSTSGRGPESEVTYAGGPQGATVVNGWFRRTARGRAPFTVGVSGAQDGDGRPLNLRPRQVTVPEAGGPPLTIALEPGLTLTGRVLTPEGQGLAGVTVTGGSSSATTDAEGAFTLGGLTEGALKLQVRPPKPYVGVNDVATEAGATDLVVRLVAGLAVAGVVEGPDGRPLSSGWVSASWPAAAGRAGGNGGATVSSDGRFRVEGLPEDAVVQLQVQIWSGNDATYPPKTVKDVRAGTVDLVVRMSPGAVVEGVVVTADGTPYPGGGTVMARAEGVDNSSGWGAEVQSDGTFRLGGVAPGRVRIQVHRNDGGPAPEPVAVDAPARGVRVVLPASTPVRGRLAGAGADAAKFSVRAWVSTSPGRRSRSARVAPDGTFTLEGLTPDVDWTLFAIAADDDRYALHGPVRGGASDVVLELTAGRSIEGSVTGADGGPPPPNTFVSARASGGSAALGGRVDERGQFRLRGLPPGRYTITAQSQDGMQQAVEADVQDGARGVRLQLRQRDG